MKDTVESKKHTKQEHPNHWGTNYFELVSVCLSLMASYAQVCNSPEKSSWQNFLLEKKSSHTKNTPTKNIQIC